jgi:HD-GYP domain-containing protein (c-di-GMP phosphodiesterase class II)
VRMKELLKRFKILYEHLDAEGLLHPTEPEFWAYLRLPFPDKPVPAAEVFFEVVGREKDILAIAKDGAGEFRLPAVGRDAAPEDGRFYFDLCVFSVADGRFPALVVLEDQTPAMETQRKVTQRNNEITLLKQDLEKQNRELQAANEKLDLMGRTLAEKNSDLNRLLEIIRTQNHDLESKVRLRTRELQDSRLAVITKLARAAEYRDVDTGDHIYRIGRSCVLLGKRAGLSAEDREMLFHASLLHDVGKIGIPDAILLKPGSLTREERAVMENHTVMGARLLDQDDFILFRLARQIALHHHEKWNGRGYPEGLRGENIPIMSRICAIADVFDALMSRRPYKEAWSLDRSAETIKKGSGTAFDPSLVEAFFDVLDDIVRLRLEPDGVEMLVPEFA